MHLVTSGMVHKAECSDCAWRRWAYSLCLSTVRGLTPPTGPLLLKRHPQPWLWNDLRLLTSLLRLYLEASVGKQRPGHYVYVYTVSVCRLAHLWQSTYNFIHDRICDFSSLSRRTCLIHGPFHSPPGTMGPIYKVPSPTHLGRGKVSPVQSEITPSTQLKSP